MNKNLFFGHNDLRFLYLRYKDSPYYSISIFLLVIIVSVMLVFRVIVPQIESYFAINQQAKELREQIKTINENITLINGLDKAQLNSQLKTATTALPVDREFAGIINVIAESALKSGVSVQDFSFSFGGVLGSSDKVEKSKNLVPIHIAIATDGSVNNQKRFLKEFLEKIPLAEILSIDGDSKSLNISISFYYKPVSKITFKEDEPIPPLPPSSRSLLQKLSSWEVSAADQNIIDTIGSSSATPLF